MNIKLAVMASGRGSNFEALVHAARTGRLHAAICMLVCDQPNAPVCSIARSYDIPVISFDEQTAGKIRAAGCNLIALAGFMRIVSPEFVRQFPGRILNIHPSLLPRFRGLHAQRQALEHHETIAGCTVHVVNSEVDSGTVIAQRVVFIKPGDTEESLSARILKEEHKLYAEAIQHYSGWLS
ncbi:MAG TPA: phosphoribosylglycinamide formyltransferase [Kiritimatiellia bacterium]|nr:phosphoribosylglycinamide formyltransferase [Kiritimatiellia bacterium]HNR93365.1 phosphoribosylglycinamide formyltransferase [Kiritimatiellia bacterium]HNS79899.1 phosphoribosylglycinamide formyltransferase [Kiritimatiellia bacterium]HPA78113.1 phosphoribosylglycinamide formyltransferase [Kiritimatiellia bacterium]HQQ03576.1 phosphoribosylglycinamide formyltransferase [Kiritimatiellia bacterium]